MARELIYNENVSLKATYTDMYKKAGKNAGDAPSTNFVYALTGGDVALARYKEIKEASKHYREDEKGRPLFFTNIFHDKECDLVITRTGSTVVANNELDQMQSKLKLVTDPAVRAAAATLIAQQMFGNLTRQAAVTQSFAAPVAAPAEVEGTVVNEEPPVMASADDEASL